ncbi:MAG: chorismate synthase [Planctomycetes bacterium]|nr:chorismate synthase [Planctomycetota bacterium]
MGSTFGRLFRVTTWGESHGGAVGCTVDGCPPGLPLDLAAIQHDLDRRRPGQSRLTTQRRESDTARLLSGVVDGLTLGTPIEIMVANQDARSGDYAAFRDAYRPSHADYTYEAKYGLRDWRGGGRASARETVGRVAAGAIARRLLARTCGIAIVGYVKQVRDVVAEVDPDRVSARAVERTPVRCPDPRAAARMIALIEETRADGDSLGGIVECVARRVPPGLGEPVFDKLEADLAKAMLSLPASKGFEIGSGFAGVLMTGSEHNDPFYSEAGRVRTRTNRSGGIQGGISNGEPILLRVAFKPTATIMRPQETVDRRGRRVLLSGRGRHDPCVLPRAVPLVEAMTALVLADHYLRQLPVARGLAGLEPPPRPRPRRRG